MEELPDGEGWEDWGLDLEPERPPLPLVPIVAAVLAGGLGGALGGAMGAILAMVAVAALMVATLHLIRDARSESGARPATEERDARLLNLAGGLAEDLGIESPEVWVLERGSPNAVALAWKDPAIAVRKSLLDSCTRTELEAVVSFLLIGLSSGEAARLRRPRWVTFPVTPEPQLTELDANAAALTRYPPGLASALCKAVPESAPVGLWLVPSEVEPPPAVRAVALLDL